MIDKISCAKLEMTPAEKKMLRNRIRQVQADFLLRVSNGQKADKAFWESITTMNKRIIDNDTFESKDSEKIEKCCFCTRQKMAAIKPKEIKEWLEVIATAVPVATSIIDLITKRNSNDNA